ncbi:ABC transporter ATP-binding protein [Streptococcus pneumoniae]|uniref:ABC transporter ATP-binding protein n=1 Tax=Streptococcus pneumoniae TaxID=1313 RepID=UPI0035577001
MVSAKRINQVLDLHSSIQNPVQVQLTDENFKGQVEFKDVTFRYAANSEAVIEHVSFKAETGQTVAFIGSTGSGKSTLVNLIPRFYDVSAGEILVDGVNVQDYDFSATAVNLLMKFYEIDKGSIHIDGVDTKAMTRSEVHDAFSMVLQDTWLFEGTIRDNLIYNQIGISDERMMEASKAVGIHHFIMTLPDGYDTILDDTVTLSVGQKQLLTIARALLKDAPLLILDEATSSVDTRTEELIQKAMDRLMEGRTSFVIAHRLSTIRNADLILVMKDGNIIEQGNYEELMAQGGFYADLYNSQFTEDEAEE